jgi:uncharacterized protein YjgD (DUF1641 family)
MTKKTAGQLLLEKLEAESAAIHKAMETAAASPTGLKISEKKNNAVEAVEAVAEEVIEEIVDDSSLLLKKVKAFLPSRSTTFHVLKIVVYWEVVRMIVKFIFIES